MCKYTLDCRKNTEIKFFAVICFTLFFLNLIFVDTTVAAIYNDKSVLTVGRDGVINPITLDYSAQLNEVANYNEIYVSDVYLDNFDGKSILTLEFKVKKRENEIVRGVGMYVKASPVLSTPNSPQSLGFESYIYCIDKLPTNICKIRFPIRNEMGSFHIDELAYYVDLQEVPYGEGQIKRLWVNHNGRNYTHEDIFSASLDPWELGSTRETYKLQSSAVIFEAARKYYGCSQMFR